MLLVLLCFMLALLRSLRSLVLARGARWFLLAVLRSLRSLVLRGSMLASLVGACSRSLFSPFGSCFFQPMFEFVIELGDDFGMLLSEVKIFSGITIHIV